MADVALCVRWASLVWRIGTWPGRRRDRIRGRAGTGQPFRHLDQIPIADHAVNPLLIKRTAAAALLALVLGLGYGCQGQQLPASAPQAPVTADGFTQMFAGKNDWTWSGGDQAASFMASNGVTYWLFGDTVVGERDPDTGAYRPGWRFLPNSILRQDGATLKAAIDGTAVPNAPDGDRYWPLSMFETNGLLYVFTQRVRNTETYFEFRGTELAVFELRPDGKLSFVAMRDTPSSWTGTGDTAAHAQYGADAVVSNGWLHVFGYANQPGDPFCPHRSYLARVPVNSVEMPSAWQFWGGAGAGWQAKMAAASPILSGQVTSVRLIDGIWLLAHKPWNSWGSTILIELRSELTEPPQYTVKLDSPGGPNFVTYLPQLHPEQPLASGNLLLSVSYNGFTLNDISRDANLYKPRFVDVALPDAGTFNRN